MMEAETRLGTKICITLELIIIFQFLPLTNFANKLLKYTSVIVLQHTHLLFKSRYTKILDAKQYALCFLKYA